MIKKILESKLTTHENYFPPAKKELKKTTKKALLSPPKSPSTANIKDQDDRRATCAVL